ncbi:hypothetical protein AS593_09645 [Caulobacter vibrioides]|nr:hypothetical protein AS593_09645 [Caulobacter vibrioides]
MSFDVEHLPVTEIEKIERELELAIGRAVGEATVEGQDVGLIADLNRLRVDLGEPLEFARLKQLLATL